MVLVFTVTHTHICMLTCITIYTYAYSNAHINMRNNFFNLPVRIINKENEPEKMACTFLD